MIMANNLYTTKTASLKATKADVGKLNTNKFDSSEIRLRGQNIEELLKLSPKELVFRCELPEDKPWSLWTDDGNLLYFNKSEEIVNGRALFSYRPITSFDSDLSSLTNGDMMFYRCKNLTTFSSDLPNLTNGTYMFRESSLASITSDLSSLENGSYMFCWCRKLTSFNSDLSNLTNGTSMFYKTCLDFTSIKHIITCL